MATGYLSPIGLILQAFTDQGVVLSGGLVNTYVAGTTTPVTTYTDSTLTVPNANPIVLSATGRLPASVWAPSGIVIKMVLQTSTGGTITGGTVDNLPGINDPNSLSIYSQSAQEIAAGVTPTSLQYPVGDPRRYGAVMDGVTDDSAAFAKCALVFTQGVNVVIPPLQMMLSSQVTFLPPSFRRGLITGYGCEIFTTNAISAIQVQGNTDPHGVTVQGIKVNQRGNTTATYGFEAVGTSHIIFRDCVVEANNCQSNYGGFIARSKTPSDSSTGAFWSTFTNCSVRKRSGGDAGTIPNGFILQGACNGSTVSFCTVTAAVNGITMQPETGQTTSPNAILITGCALEGNTIGILANQSTASISGLRIIGNRAESLTTFLSLTGASSQPAFPTYLSGNYLISSVSTYISNVNNLYITSLDFGITPNLGTSSGSIVTDNALDVNPTNGTNVHAVTGWASAGGYGFGLKDNNGTVRSRWAYNTGPVGARLTAIQSIARSDNATGNNLAGNGTFSASTTATVTFANAEPDANFRVSVTPTADPAGRIWVTAKATSGFTVNSSSSTSATFDWIIIRD